MKVRNNIVFEKVKIDSLRVNSCVGFLNFEVLLYGTIDDFIVEDILLDMWVSLCHMLL